MSAKLKKLIKELREKRKEYIKAEIKTETGIKGFLRRLNFSGVKKRDDLPEYVFAHTEYMGALSNFRLEIIEEFKKNRCHLFESSIPTIYKITVTDEIGRLRHEKEKKIRSLGLSGILREKTQDLRETAAGLKMILGALLIAVGTAPYFLNPKETIFFQAVAVALGAMFALEGLWQEMSLRREMKLGITRSQIFRKAERRLGDEIRGLSEKLKRMYVSLEQEIWRVRQFEKRAELAQYFIAILGGVIAGALFVFPEGKKIMAEVAIVSLFGYLFCCLIVPLGLINSSFEKKNKFGSSKEYFSEKERMP